MRKINKQSEGYKTKAQLKKERKELRRKSQMEKKFLIGLYDDYRKDGCLNGIMRKQILEILKKMEGIEVKETSISPFDLQKADELFLTNVISGIQPITKYRKKEYTTEFASDVLKRLNAKIRLS